MKDFNAKDYTILLKNWVVFSQKHLYTCPENEAYICYGAGEHGHWGVHTHQKAFSAFAILATSDGVDWSDCPVTKEQVLSQALGMLRYTLHTHLEGDFVCTDGEKWGHNWIYVLGIERMFHAIEALEAYLTAEDKALLKKVLISESDFLLNAYPITAGLERRCNRPESNIWNGATLYRTATLYPDAPNKEAYMKKARAFFANGISIEADENSDEIVDGERIGDLFIGANMFNSFACNHHGYLNIGYMYICLSNIAMLHFFLKSKGVKADDMIYHNLYKQWQLIRSTTFDDGRLLRIGGDSRARYCYCQDYALPSWLLIEDVYGEDCSMLIDGWLEILKKETAVNGDGSFLSNRFGHFENLSPVYYTRLESDRANVVSMALYWHSKYAISGEKPSELLTAWKDDFHGSGFDASGNRFASFTWSASEKPQGLLVPKNDSSLAEWRYNLGAKICGVGRENFDEEEANTVQLFDGGFITCGTTVSYSDNFMAEGQEKEAMARKHIAFAALPDENTVLCLQYARSLNRVFTAKIAGTLWNIPNDIFNGRQRKLTFEHGSGYFSGGDYARTYETVALGHFVNADDKIGLASKLPLTLVRSGERQIDIKLRENSGTLYAEEICAPYEKAYKWVDRNTVLIDTGFALSLGTAEDTQKLNTSLTAPELGNVKAIGVTGKDGKNYLLLANFTDSEQTVNLQHFNALNLANGKKAETICFKPNEAVLLVKEEIL